MLEADKVYIGEVAPGSHFMRSKTKGTLGFVVKLDLPDSSRQTEEFTIWLTEQTKDRAEKTFIETLNITLDELRDSAFVENKLADVIVGCPIAAGAKAEEYNGKTMVKIAWIGKPREPKPEEVADATVAAVRFFGGKAEEHSESEPPSDGDVPF